MNKMEGIYPAISGSLLQEKRLEILANNLANISTIGFKQDRPVFETYFTSDSSPYQSLVPNEINPEEAYVVFTGIKTIFSQGEFRYTGNPLDLAINGNGFFVIETPEGNAYTRKGNFTINNEGLLVTQEGLPVMGEGGTITIQGSQITIDNEGNIFADDNLVATLSVVDFPEPYPLQKIGDSLLVINNPELEETSPAGATIQQGHLELSNVQATKAMVEMIDIMRSYEAYQKIIQSFNEEELKTINEVGKI
jgi:flagellar basal-body rod protein FlgF